MPVLETIALISLLVGGTSAIGGASKRSKAQTEQDEAQADAEAAQRAQWQTELATHQFNIKVAEKGLREGTADISREGARSQRLRGAAMGASGATLGFGTPLMNMISSAAGIERDKSRLAAQTQLDIDFARAEIEKLSELLVPNKGTAVEAKPITAVEPLKKKKPTSTGGRDRTGSANLGRA